MSAILTFASQNESILRLILCLISFALVFYSNWLMHWNNSLKTTDAAWVWFFSTVLGLSIAVVVFIHIDFNPTSLADLDLTDLRLGSMFVGLVEMVVSIIVFTFNGIFLWMGIPQWEKLTV